MGKVFTVVPWPPGRACSEHNTKQTRDYEWDYVTDDDGQRVAAKQLLDIISSLPTATQAYISQEVLALMSRAEEGKCVPTIWKEGKRVQHGQVDRMGYGKADVLELKVFRKLQGVPPKNLRLYFVEPTTRVDLLAISARAKPATKKGLKDQDCHWKEAQVSADEWWPTQDS